MATPKLRNITNIEIKTVATYILEELKSLGIFMKYAGSSEVSFGFEDKRVGSLRMANFPSPTYQYRWNLRSPELSVQETKYKSHWYELEYVDDFIDHITRYAATIKANDVPKSADGEPTPPNSEQVPLDVYADSEVIYRKGSKT